MANQNVSVQPQMKLSGAVLAGGRSSRFGTDKAQFIWHKKTLLEWALESFIGLEDVMVIGGSVATISDSQPFLGALHGLQTALENAVCPRVAIMACDMPNLSRAYWCFLESIKADIVIPQNKNQQLEPLAAIYSRSCLGLVQKAIARDDLKLSGWWQNQSEFTTEIITWQKLEPFFPSDIFLNANSPKDLA